MKTLKAYEVRDNYEGNCVIEFATSGAPARREGANALDTDWDGIESCKRAPQYDSYAPGPVPPMVLLEHGWWFECSHCGIRVSQDDEPEDADGEPIEPDPQPHGLHGIFCSKECDARYHAEQRANKRAKTDLIEVFEARWPGATIDSVHVYGQRLAPSEKGTGTLASVHFKFPGCKYGGTWIFGENGTAHIAQADLEAFQAWGKTLKQGGV